MMMNAAAVAVVLATLPLVTGAVSVGQSAPPSGKLCRHDASETAEQKTRRLDALTATRTVNNIQANRPEAKNRTYLRQDQLAASPFAATMKNSTNEAVRRISLTTTQDILAGWKLTLDVTETGYWFMIKDTTDPCGYAFISNQNGVIYTSEPLR